MINDLVQSQKDEGVTMEFHVGDKVVHRAYGVGEIVQFDKKNVGGQVVSYYVVQTRNLTVWVPVNGGGDQSLRLPTRPREFKKAFKVLSSAGEQLSTDRFERKTHLSEQLRKGTIESTCRVIRDLSLYGRIKKLNDNDVSIMERAQSILLEEWILSLSVPLSEAQQELKHFLDGGFQAAKPTLSV